MVRNDRREEILLTTCLEIERHGHRTAEMGRGDMRSIALADGNIALFRRYRHGGLFRSLSGACFFTWPPRPFRELCITEELRHRGVPTVEVYGACVERIGGPFYRGILITRKLEDSRDLWEGLRSGFCAALGMDSVLQAIALAIRRMHREGVYHSDLNLKNILLRSMASGIESRLIDFDKAILVLGELPQPLAQKNLDRLLRSIRKLDPQRQYFSPAAWQGFLDYYHAAAA